MAGNFTDEGRVQLADYYFRAATLPTNYYLALITNAVACDNDTNTLGELTQISDGGYTTNGLAVTPATEFDNLTEGSSTASIQITDQQWTATTSIAPAQAVLTDDNVTPASRKVLAYFDVSGTASAGQTYTIVDAQININFDSGQFTDKGMYEILNYCFEGAAAPTQLYVALIRSAVAPAVGINTLSELTQISTATGYSDGGYTLNRDNTDFDSLVDGTTQAELQIKDLVWTASGGNLDSGAGARYAVITGYHVTPGSRSVLAWWDLTTDRNVTDGNTFTLANLEMQFTV